MAWWNYYLEAKVKKTVTEGLVASDSTTSIAAPRGITEDSFKLTLDKFKNQAFKRSSIQGLCCQTSSKLSTAESTQARGGDCQGVCREAPGDQ